MISDDRTAGPVGFNAVDTSADPGGLIRFLDAANGTAGLTAAKRALLEQLDLGRAHAALDVGCGPGIDIAQMAVVGRPGRVGPSRRLSRRRDRIRRGGQPSCLKLVRARTRDV
jgi:hypothetical protein